MTNWRLSPQANRDLLDLYLYGAETFGRTAALAYLDSLHACFTRLTLNPRIGRSARTAGEGLRRLEHRRHVVFYETEPDCVRIVAVIHECSLRGIDV